MTAAISSSKSCQADPGAIDDETVSESCALRGIGAAGEDLAGGRGAHETSPGLGGSCVSDQVAVVCTSRRRLSMVILTARIDNAGERRSRYHNAFHHAGTTMMASPRNTARRARSANFSGAIGRNVSADLRRSSSLTPSFRPYTPPVMIGVRITPGQSTETCTPWR